jgi:hypothetical protein
VTLDEIAEVRPGLLDFTAGMLGGLARKDQRAAGELYVRGLLTDGRRKSMVPMAERLGIDHQRLQQFITSSTWDYAGVRANVARWLAGRPRSAHDRISTSRRPSPTTLMLHAPMVMARPGTTVAAGLAVKSR